MGLFFPVTPLIKGKMEILTQIPIGTKFRVKETGELVCYSCLCDSIYRFAEMSDVGAPRHEMFATT